MERRIIKATLDRIEDGIAVFIVSENETSLEWPENELPDDIQEGDTVTIFIRMEKNLDETREGKKRIADKLEQLRKRNGK
ncbi:DUF3006 domain-containing protein [Listeria aquatica]|uniref:DUF3006 domain-containing protein n=1 Tax=Listeria aquatica TaxID=1494960 RepID=UPI003D076235